MEANQCCGPPREQYCCTVAEARQQGFSVVNPSSDNQPYESRKKGNGPLFYIFFIIVPLIFVVLVGVMVWMFYCKKRIYQEVPQEPVKNKEPETEKL